MTAARPLFRAPPDALDAEALRRDFPALNQKIHGFPLAYLDNAASAQKPRAVLEAMTRFYENDYANIHRGVHELSQRATNAYENARKTAQRFINANAADEIVFTRGATESLNLVASSFSRAFLREGDEVVITELEHHANIVPWQVLAKERGVILKPAPITPGGSVDAAQVEALLTKRTKLVSVAHVSNALGTVLPVADIIAAAKKRDIPVLLDGCQAVGHMPVDVRALGCDFYVFSGHKLYGPTGIGVLYGRKEWLAEMPPWQTGGDMIESVSFKGTTFREPPARFEAGTPPIAGAVGLAAAIDYVSAIGMERIADYERRLADAARAELSKINRITFYGPRDNHSPIISFNLEGAHAHDVGSILDRCGVAARTGHHCAEPLMERLGVPGTTRVSFAFYNTPADIEALCRGLEKTREIFP